MHGSLQPLEFAGHLFTQVAAIEPQRNPDGSVQAFLPENERYRGRKLNPYGQGPFCKFSLQTIPAAGVYCITSADHLVYVGETENLQARFGPRGYGSIHARNRYAAETVLVNGERKKFSPG